jgi:hypothetical protein
VYYALRKTNTFLGNTEKQGMDKLWTKYARNSRGWRQDGNAHIHMRIVIGSATRIIPTATHVVNCAEDALGCTDFKTAYPSRYACIGAIDSVHEDITKWYPAFEKVMNAFLADPECKVVYVHCECGINRSAFLTLMYVCIKFGYSVEAVIKNIAIQRPCVFTNIVYRTQAIEYIKKHT